MSLHSRTNQYGSLVTGNMLGRFYNDLVFQSYNTSSSARFPHFGMQRAVPVFISEDNLGVQGIHNGLASKYDLLWIQDTANLEYSHASSYFLVQ